MPSVFDIVTVFFVLVAAIGVINHRWLGMPHSVGLVLFSVASSGALMAADRWVPDAQIPDLVESVVRAVDFRSAILNGLLGFLLFAGALHVDFRSLAHRKTQIAVMTVLGVLVGTLVVGVACHLAWVAIGIPVPLVACLVFGALVSPTDPIAALSVMKRVPVPRDLAAEITGESLFNDGLAIVVFSATLSAAAYSMGFRETPVDAAALAVQFAREVAGGCALGFALGYLATMIIRPVDDHPIEIMVTIGLVMATISLSRALGVSVAASSVTAGLLIGEHGMKVAMSDRTRRHLLSFWGVLDEVLNSFLFVLLGLEMVVIPFHTNRLIASAVAIPAVLFGRWVSVVASAAAARSVGRSLAPGAVSVLTWGGMRGALSVALVLSLPPNPYKHMLVAVTWVVCVASIAIQGSTIKRVIARAAAKYPPAPAAPADATAPAAPPRDALPPSALRSALPPPQTARIAARGAEARPR
jgi:CPA1 family monovalent cation:H+ antiporter